MITYAVDFESFYDSECSITTLGPAGYFSHPSFEAYMVTVVGDDGYVYAGCPRAFDWAMLNGHTVLSHNASFDESLYLHGVRCGWFKSCTPAEWHCTADMVAYLGLPRSLKNASAALFDIKVDKTTRDNMKGLRWDSMSEEFRKEVTQYAIVDSELCLRIWTKLNDQWPQVERDISRMNRKICQRGLPIDVKALRENIVKIGNTLFDAERSIPWIGDATPLSRKAFNAQCRKQGIDPPKSLAADSEDANKWFAEHQQECPWARAVQDYRRINMFQKKLQAFDYGTMPDDRYYGGLMYCGANPTARFSGSGGNLNLQNLPREEMFGVNFRHMIKPKAGNKLIVVDLSQIEVRTLSYLSGDKRSLDMIRQAKDIYHAFGVLLGMHDPANGELKEYDKDLRLKVKAMVLGCGYSIGPSRFAEYSGMTLQEAEVAVRTYRMRMKPVVNYWAKLNQELVTACALGVPFELDLPSGRTLRYGKLRKMKAIGDRFAIIGKMYRMGGMRDIKLYGGTLAENCVSHDSEVLTYDAGWVRVADVKVTQRVWDGTEFVLHDGFIDKGRQPVVDVFGVYATSDHRFLVGEDWVAADKACRLPIEEASSPPYEAQGLYGTDVWDVHHHTEGGFNQRQEREIDESPVGAAMPMWEGRDSCVERNTSDQDLRIEVPDLVQDHIGKPDDSRPIGAQTIRSVALNERQMPPTHTPSMEELRGSRDSSLPKVAGEFPKLLGRYAPNVEGGIDVRPDRQQQGLQPRELSVGYVVPTGPQHEKQPDTVRDIGFSQDQRGEMQHPTLPYRQRMADADSRYSKTQLQKQVGDLLNCGPNSRFAVRAGAGHPVLIAHNCSQGLARDIFSDMMLRIDAAGYPIILHVHDEVVCEVPEDIAEGALGDILNIMSTPPDWIPDIPVSAEGHILDIYTK